MTDTIPLPKLILRKAGDGKRKADATDIVDLWDILDKSKIVCPDFYALNLQRIPQTYSAVRDAPGLATVVMELKDQLARMEVKVDGLTS